MKFVKFNWPAMALLLLLFFSLSAVAQTTTFQTANLHDFNTGEELAGAGTMIRSADGVSATFSLSGLDKKAAYTAWWIIWNDPEVVPPTCPLPSPQVKWQWVSKSLLEQQKAR